MDKKLTNTIRNAGIYVILIGLAVFFIVRNMWLALVIEAIVFVVALCGVVIFMHCFTLARKAPVAMADVIGLGEEAELGDRVEEAVRWLEKGKIVEQKSFDGLILRGRLIKNESVYDNHKYMILCHGYTNHRLQDISNQAKKFYEMGYNVFAGHARGHGLSEGRYIGMGVFERRDIAGWIKMIVDQDPEAKIGLYGVSMGAATVMATVGEDLPDNVIIAIEDCGYTSAWDEFKHQLRDEFGIPVFPVLHLSDLLCYVRFGYGFRKYSPKYQLKNAKVPMLFIHGDKDTFVPYEMLDEVYDACASENKKKVTVYGAEHAESHYVDPGVYWHEVTGWLDRYFK